MTDPLCIIIIIGILSIIALIVFCFCDCVTQCHQRNKCNNYCQPKYCAKQIESQRDCVTWCLTFMSAVLFQTEEQQLAKIQPLQQIQKLPSHHTCANILLRHLSCFHLYAHYTYNPQPADKVVFCRTAVCYRFHQLQVNSDFGEYTFYCETVQTRIRHPVTQHLSNFINVLMITACSA